jgi:protein-disulfide isomerase
MNAQRLTLITVAILILGLVGFFLFNSSRDTSAPPTSEITADPTQLSYEGQPALGDANAPVKLAIFEDFKCPACAKFEEIVWPKLERDYINAGKVQAFFIYHQVIPNTLTAAVAGECVFEQNPDLFWDYKTIVYRSQENEAQNWATASKMVELARTYVPDINADELNTCIAENRHEDKVLADDEMGKAVGVQSTPSLFVNGQRFETQAQTFDDFYVDLKTMIDAAALGN